MSSLKSNPDIYVFNNSKDTIYLTKVKLRQWTITQSIKMVDTVQIDGLGSSEYEIWNVDTNTLLIEAVNSFEYDYNRMDAHITFPDSLQGSYGFGKGIKFICVRLLN